MHGATIKKINFFYKCGSRKCFDLRDEFRTGTFMIRLGYLLLLKQRMKILTGSSHMGLSECYIIWRGNVLKSDRIKDKKA
jgi:hypothetical protein